MKRYILASENSYAWMAKYKDITNKIHKVVAELPTSDFEEAEEMFDEIIPEAYVELRVLGKVLSVQTAENDGSEVLKY